MIGHGGTRRGDHAVRIDSAFLCNGMLQGGVAVGAVAIDLQLIDGDRKVAQRERTDAAGGEIKVRTALGFCPQHVVGVSLSHSLIASGPIAPGSGYNGSGRDLRLQYKYTGMPASRIISPMAEFAGNVQIVAVTIAAQACTKRAVV